MLIEIGPNLLSFFSELSFFIIVVLILVGFYKIITH